MACIILNTRLEEVAVVCGKGVSLLLMGMCYHVVMIKRGNIRLEISSPHRLRISIMVKKQTASERQFSESGLHYKSVPTVSLKQPNANALYQLY